MSLDKQAVQLLLAQYKAEKLSLDMTRGKPSPQQLDLANALLTNLSEADYLAEDGTDCRNYGGLDGLPETKKLFADYMQVSTKEIIIGGNASLPLMHNAMTLAMLFGTTENELAWGGQETVKFICPVPGYDRHFSICEHLGIEMINVPMTKNGLDIDTIESLVASDETIKGMWCVPKYSNPTGDVYSADTVKRLASMNTLAKDFRIFWDNAYAVHYLENKPAVLEDIFAACKAVGNEDRVYMFGSTSKITFASAGIGVIAASENNINYFKKHMSFQTIGPDKINQLRHNRFFKNTDGILKHMEKHAALLAPKFNVVLDVLENNLGGVEINGKAVATWDKPEGGYFISLDTQDGMAKKVIAMALDLGVKLTPAGAPFPYGIDPNDSNIRIAPSFPSIDEMKKATEVLATCILAVTMDA